MYRDGLRIYTTIDSRLQSIAEQSVNDHMKNLQSEFFYQNKESEENPTPPFRDLREGQVDTLLKLSAMRSERWRKMKLSGKNEDEIWEYFVKNNLIFSTDISLDKRFIHDAPYSKFGLSIDFESSPMVGKWIGYNLSLIHI